ncbi:MAG TPA: PEGA domain-containing protein [Polyangia bacterium]|jgi:hypothetical protein|nr:PEGA domain-containing protein [Polyangia bacterium]
MKTLVFLVLLVSAGCAHSLQSLGVAFRVDSNVADATVWIDDIFVGQVSEWQHEGKFIRPGFHRIEIRHPNYYSVFQEIEPAAGTQTTIKAQLHAILQ